MKNFISITIILTIFVCPFSFARTWTAKSGDAVVGDFVKLEDGFVYLTLSDGKTAKVPLDQLLDEDQTFVTQQTKKNKSPFVIEDAPPAKQETDPNTIKIDENTPIDVLKAEAEKGNTEAQFRLGLAYVQGIGGLQTDETEAVRWFRRCAEQDNPLGQLALGSAYHDGIGGLPRDDRECEKWLTKSAEQGNRDAKTALEQIKQERKNVADNIVNILDGLINEGNQIIQEQRRQQELKQTNITLDTAPPLRSIAHTYRGGFARVDADGSVYAKSIPQECVSWLKKYKEEGKFVKSVAFTRDGGFVILCGKNGYQYHNIPSELKKHLKEGVDKGYNFYSVAIGQRNEYIFLTDKHFWYSANCPREIIEAVKAVDAGGGQNQNVMFGKSGSWLLQYKKNNQFDAIYRGFTTEQAQPFLPVTRRLGTTENSDTFLTNEPLLIENEPLTSTGWSEWKQMDNTAKANCSKVTQMIPGGFFIPYRYRVQTNNPRHYQFHCKNTFKGMKGMEDEPDRWVYLEAAFDNRGKVIDESCRDSEAEPLPEQHTRK